MKLLSAAAAVPLFIAAIPLAILLMVIIPHDEWSKLNDSLPPP